MKLKQFGEFKLIELIKKQISSPGYPPLAVGPGDDAFVARTTPGRLIAATTDVLVENVHFSRTWTTPEQLGYKSITVNLSDLHKAFDLLSSDLAIRCQVPMPQDRQDAHNDGPEINQVEDR